KTEPDGDRAGAPSHAGAVRQLRSIPVPLRRTAYGRIMRSRGEATPQLIREAAMTTPIRTELPIDRDTAAGAVWARHDIETATTHGGKWAVALVGQIVAVGDDAEAVRVLAAQRLNRDPKRLVVCAITHPAA